MLIISFISKGLDFNTFDRNVDFYLLKFDMFNLCTPYLTKESVIPLSGDLPYTLVMYKITYFICYTKMLL